MASPACRTSQVRHRIDYVYDEARRAGDLTVRVYAETFPLPGAPLPQDFCSRSTRSRSATKTMRASPGRDGGQRHGAVIGCRRAGQLPRRGRTADYRLAEGPYEDRLDARQPRLAGGGDGEWGSRGSRRARLRTRPPPHRARASPNDGVIASRAWSWLIHDDVPRFEGLGVIASLQPAHARPDRLQIWSRNVGAERSALGWASHSLAGAGARLAFGSDRPNLPLDPVAGLNAAVNRSISRRTQEGETIEEERPADAVLYAGEALALKSAINAWTSSAAWASFDEHRKGMIKAGMLADLVVLSADILGGTPEKLAVDRSGCHHLRRQGRLPAGSTPLEQLVDERSHLSSRAARAEAPRCRASDRRRRRPGPRAAPP